MQVTRHHSVLIVLLLFELWTSADCAGENKKRRHEERRRHGDGQPDFRWDVWADWSPCSVDCGTGTTARSRQCRSMLDGQKTDGCEGLEQEIKLCSIEDCIAADGADEACRELDTNEYGGRRYTWKPYKNPKGGCSLACSAVGHGFYLEVDRNVTDGTPCTDDGAKVCVQGLCKSLGCDGIVDSGAEEDTCGVCGGDDSSCKPVIRTFGDSVKSGYHTIGTIPPGASNIVVTEIKASRNYLGLKSKDGTFSLNTDFRLSRFGEHPGAGTVWTYARRDGPDCPGECIRADGPTGVTLEVVALFYTNNKGIKFSYNIDKDSAPVEETKTAPSPIVLQNGAAIKEGDGDVNKKQNTVTENRPIFSHDFKFRNNRRRRQHRRRNRGRDRHREDRQHRRRGSDVRDRERRINEVPRKSSEGYPGRQVPTVTVDEDSENESDRRAVTEEGDSKQQAQNIQGKAPVAKISTQTVPASTDTDGDRDVDVVPVRTDPPAARIAEDDFGGGVYLSEETDTDRANLERGELTAATDKGETVVDADANVGDMYRSDNRGVTSLYSWRVAGYSDCSATCGEGKQSPNVECIVTDKRTAVADMYCADVSRPDFPVLACNHGTCPPSWQARAWGKCSVSCGQGVQSRDYTCTRHDGVELSSRECAMPRPDREEKSCNVGSCVLGWYFTAWPAECPAMCGDGQMTRNVHCVSDTGNVATACPASKKPAAEKSCNADQCMGYWFTGPWAECNATCGMAYQTRSVVCVSKQRGAILTVVPDSSCRGEEKPSTYMSCDLEDCGSQWFMNEWSKCTVTCGSGERSRDVRCLDKDKRPKSGCDPQTKPVERERCKNRTCPSKDEGRSSKEDGKCTDSFIQCTLVLQARLCKYKYYKKICCGSCSMVDAL